MFRWKNFIYEDIHSRDGNRVNFNNGYWPRHYFFFFFSLLIISYHMNLNDSIVLSFLSFSLTFSIYKLIETTNRWSINNESFNCKKKGGVKMTWRWHEQTHGAHKIYWVNFLSNYINLWRYLELNHYSNSTIILLSNSRKLKENFSD